MPIQYFQGETLANTTTAEVTEFRIQKNIAKPGFLSTNSTASISRVTRIRSLYPKPCTATSNLKGTLRRKLMFAIGSINTNFRGEIRFFLSVKPVIPPTTKLLHASGRSFASSRIIKGDLIPIKFQVKGQKLSDLYAQFIAKPLNANLSTITKTSIHLTNPVKDGDFEFMEGTFSLDPSDTISFPDVETEFRYRLKLLDGMGRSYTCECHNFTVYSC